MRKGDPNTTSPRPATLGIAASTLGQPASPPGVAVWVMLNRRGFLGSILSLCAAPAIVRADSLMRVVPRDALILALDDIWAAAAVPQTMNLIARVGGFAQPLKVVAVWPRDLI